MINFDFIFTKKYHDIASSTLIDDRKLQFNGANGNVIEPIVANLISSIDGSTLFYSIEAEQGNCAGFFLLKYNVDYLGTLNGLYLRPPFKQFQQQITNQINAFILSRDFRANILY